MLTRIDTNAETRLLVGSGMILVCAVTIAERRVIAHIRGRDTSTTIEEYECRESVVKRVER